MRCACGSDCTDLSYSIGRGPEMCERCYVKRKLAESRRKEREADRHFANLEAGWRLTLGL